MKYKEYAVYVGDEFRGLGTVQELAKIMNVAVSTIRYYTSPAYEKRVSENGIRLVKLDEIDESGE